MIRVSESQKVLGRFCADQLSNLGAGQQFETMNSYTIRLSFIIKLCIIGMAESLSIIKHHHKLYDGLMGYNKIGFHTELWKYTCIGDGPVQH